MRSNTARDTEKRRQVRAALVMFNTVHAKNTEIQWRDLFPIDGGNANYDWQRNVLGRLIDQKRISRVPHANTKGRSLSYKVLTPFSDAEVDQDGDYITGLIWPRASFAGMREEAVRAEPPQEDHPKPFEAAGVLEPTDAPSPPEAPTEEKYREVVIKLLFAVVENLAYMRTILEDIRKANQDLVKKWE